VEHIIIKHNQALHPIRDEGDVIAMSHYFGMTMIKILHALAGLLFVLATNVMAFDETTEAKVLYIDESDPGFTKIAIDKYTSCGAKWFWMLRTEDNYNVYMARVLTALVTDRTIRINERPPGKCKDIHLYNPRIGIM